MKTKVLLLFLSLFSVGTFAQQQINTFYTFPSVIAVPESNTFYDHYSLVTSETIDQSPSGENAVWNFNDLAVITYTQTEFRQATPAEAQDYPGSNFVVETYIEGQEAPTHYYLSLESATSSYSLAGADMGGTQLTYTDLGFIGDFPLIYGYTNTDDIEGTFLVDNVSGTFTGTATVTVDAYGSLTVNEGLADDMPVVRLKAEQQLTLYLAGMPLGTIEQTLYHYYDTSEETMYLNPVFRSIEMHFSVPTFQIDETTQSYESYIGSTANVKGFTKNSFYIAPNPVEDVLHFAGDAAVNSVTITDASGRVILRSNAGNDIQISHLSAGVYYVAAETQYGSQAIKMIKK